MTAMEFSSKLMNLQNNLQYFANSLTCDKEEAKDLLQDTYLKALVNRDKFADDTNLKAWTFTIMKNTFINNYRKNHKINTIVDNTEDLFYLNIQRKSEFQAPDSEYHVKEIQKKIAHLDEVQRLPFEMHHAGYKYKEIAENLNISIGTVKSRIFFTRKKLMQSLEDFQC
jgi:RNA polymerase sigma-70 factor (ECF subfamily)